GRSRYPHMGVKPLPLHKQPMPSRHSTERGSAGSTTIAASLERFYPALLRSVLCLLGISEDDLVHKESIKAALRCSSWTMRTSRVPLREALRTTCSQYRAK